MKGVSMDKYIYAVRDNATGEFMNARCHSNGKYYEIKKFAQNRCDKYNSKGYNLDYPQKAFEVVTFKLVEVNTEKIILPIPPEPERYREDFGCLTPIENKDK